MDNITLYSRFPNRDVAQAFNTLQYRERLSETDRDLDSIPLIKKLKSYLNINPSKDDADAMFRDRMKLIINDSINKYIKTLERLRL